MFNSLFYKFKFFKNFFENFLSANKFVDLVDFQQMSEISTCQKYSVQKFAAAE